MALARFLIISILFSFISAHANIVSRSCNALHSMYQDVSYILPWNKKTLDEVKKIHAQGLTVSQFFCKKYKQLIKEEEKFLCDQLDIPYQEYKDEFRAFKLWVKQQRTGVKNPTVAHEVPPHLVSFIQKHLKRNGIGPEQINILGSQHQVSSANPFEITVGRLSKLYFFYSERERKGVILHELSHILNDDGIRGGTFDCLMGDDTKKKRMYESMQSRLNHLQELYADVALSMHEPDLLQWFRYMWIKDTFSRSVKQFTFMILTVLGLEFQKQLSDEANIIKRQKQTASILNNYQPPKRQTRCSWLMGQFLKLSPEHKFLLTLGVYAMYFGFEFFNITKSHPSNCKRLLEIEKIYRYLQAEVYLLKKK